MEIKEILKDILKQKEARGKVKDIVWIAAGGSHGGFYPAQYFMEHEAKSIVMNLCFQHLALLGKIQLL